MNAITTHSPVVITRAKEEAQRMLQLKKPVPFLESEIEMEKRLKETIPVNGVEARKRQQGWIDWLSLCLEEYKALLA